MSAKFERTQSFRFRNKSKALFYGNFYLHFKDIKLY